MNNQTEGSSKQSAQWATIAFVLNVILFASFGMKDKWEGMNFIIAYAAVGSHLALLPVIATLRSPTWAKVGGYTWAMFDTILAVASLNGITDDAIFPYRLGLHAAVAVWPLGVALHNKGVLRWAGFALALTIGIVPLIGPLVPPQTMFIALPFIFIWLGVIIWTFRKNKI